MKEKLLQFIWQFQYFNRSELEITSGESLQILDPGRLNNHQGPDFLEGKIKINNTILIGHIEIHINAASWYLHRHDQDSHFKNIILHVVWRDDAEVKDKHGTLLPTLVLQDRVSKILLSKYQTLMMSEGFISCENQIGSVNEMVLSAWKHRLVVERLQTRALKIFSLQQENNGHWEETFWWMLASAFGIKVNSGGFQAMAKSIPVKVLAKHKQNHLQIEALLFGQAGLLEEDFSDSYPLMLKKEHEFLSKKYGLAPSKFPLYFLRMRPANFPSIRLAQLSALICESEHLFSKVLSITSIEELKGLFDVQANDYWHYHYVFDVTSKYKVKQMGVLTVNNIIINTIVPMIYAYSHFHKNDELKEKAISWLDDIEGDRNSIIYGFKALSISIKNAFDSQAMIQMKNEYCNEKLCLKCSIGNALIK
ncbi:MAG: DUF2851 family protein [Ginsengibacter sp.]